MASTTLLQHPCHDEHPLEPRDFSNDSTSFICDLCDWKISADGYACQECEFYAHGVCAEAPPRIDAHPLHTDHPLTLTHCLMPFRDHCCNLCECFKYSMFKCDDCHYNLDIRCALSTLSQGKTPEQLKLPLHYHKLTSFSIKHDLIGDSRCVICKASVEVDGYACLDRWCEFLIHKRCVQDLFGDEYEFNLDISCASSTLLDQGVSEDKTLKWIALPLHHHLLTSFSTSYDFIETSDCVICKASVEGEGYACLNWKCKLIIHKRCVQDLYYADGTKAPRFYHRHPLETFLGEDTGSSRCERCQSNTSSEEFIGCASCQMFYCRDCVQVPEIIQYPHHPYHNLVLLINCPDNEEQHCDACSFFFKGALSYGCPPSFNCEFFVHVECALQVLAYCEKGMSTKIELSWHKHPLFLGHRSEPGSVECSYCEENPAGPMYTCKEAGCKFQLHKRCIEIEIESTIIHPHHPDHPLDLCEGNELFRCEACSETIYYLYFSCKLCAFYLHAKCAALVPTRKQSLHEHELLHLEKAPSWKCNRCGTYIGSPFFRCVPCNFNLHEECMELPLQVNSKVHWHPLTLHETYIEDDSGEYYCDLCEKRRDDRMGVYVCLQCSARWAYHIECVFPELLKVFEKGKTSSIRRLNERIARKDEEVHSVEVKREEMKQELDQLIKERDEIIEERDELILLEGD